MPPTPSGGEVGSGGGQQKGQRSGQVSGDQVLSFDVIVSKSVTEAAEFLRTAQMGIDRQKEYLAQREAELKRGETRLLRGQRRLKMQKKKLRRIIRGIQSIGISLDSSGSERSDSSTSSSESTDEFARKQQKKRPAGRSRTPVMNRRPTKKRKTTNETTGTTTDSRKTDSSVTAPGPCEGEGSPGVVDPAVQQEEKEAKAAGSFNSENGKVFWNRRSRAWIASWKDEESGGWRTKSFNPRTKYDGNVQSARDDAIVFLTARPKVKSPASSDPTKKEASSGGEDDEEHEGEIQTEMLNGEDAEEGGSRKHDNEAEVIDATWVDPSKPLVLTVNSNTSLRDRPNGGIGPRSGLGGFAHAMYALCSKAGKCVMTARREMPASKIIDKCTDSNYHRRNNAATNDGRVEVVECSLVSSSSSSDESPNRRRA